MATVHPSSRLILVTSAAIPAAESLAALVPINSQTCLTIRRSSIVVLGTCKTSSKSCLMSVNARE
jgi:hypothetical protein